MKCAASFLSVVVLVVSVSVAAIYILWLTQECRSHHFRCEEDGNCIPFQKLCDGVPDCRNGSDEYTHECADLTSLPELFRQHLGRKLNSTRLPEHDAKCEIRVPVGCTCTKGYRAYCDNITWPTVPWNDFDKNTTRLLLNNVIDKGGDYGWINVTEPMTNLESLTLEGHPHCRKFPWDLLRQNERLRYLFLPKSGLTTLEPGIFSQMPQLRYLFLQENGLQYIDRDSLSNLPNLMWLDISYNNLDLADYKFRKLPSLIDLNITSNRMRRIEAKLFGELRNLTFLTLRNNEISYIHERAFLYNINLKDLDISRNRIRQMSPSTFNGLVHLAKLVIGGNPLESVSSSTYCSLQNLESLNLDGIEIEIIDLEIFSCFQLQYVHFKKFQFCRFTPRVPKCYPNSDGLSSTKNLLNGKGLRLIIWVVAALTILGNITVMISRWFSKRQSRVLDVFIKNLAGADILTGFYLIVLASKDIETRDQYNQQAYLWTSSWLCSTIGVLAMISCEVSLLILTIMSLERYLVISGPFSAPKLSRNLAHISMAIIWIFAITLALTPVLHWRGKSSFYGSTGLCFPLHLDDPFSTGWEYSAFVFIGLNSICLILISISYGKLFWVIRQTRLSTPIFIRDMEMAVRFFFMVVSDFLCWVPIILFKIAVLHGYEIPQDIHSWLLIFVLPLNSAINPFLYTFSTGSVRIKFVQQLITTLTRAHQYNRSSFENHTLRHAGTTIDEFNGRTPSNSILPAAKRQDRQHSFQDSVTSNVRNPWKEEDDFVCKL